MAPGRTSSAAPATRSARSKAPQAFPLMGSRGDRCPGCTNPSLPLEGFAVLNDTPVACQTREPTDPQGDRWHGEAVTDEVSPRSGVKLPRPRRSRGRAEIRDHGRLTRGRSSKSRERNAPCFSILSHLLTSRSSGSADPRRPCRGGPRRGPFHGRCRGWRPDCTSWPASPARTCRR